MVPTATQGYDKARLAISDKSLRTLRWHLEGKMFHEKVDANACDQYGNTLMHCAAETRGVVKTLLEYSAAVEPRDNRLVTPLMNAALSAVIYDETDELQILIEQGARVNARAYGGMTPLYRACEQFPWRTTPPNGIAFLLEHGADPRLGSGGGVDKPADLIKKNLKSLMEHPDYNQFGWGRAGDVLKKKVERCEEALEMLRTAEAKMGPLKTKTSQAVPTTGAGKGKKGQPVRPAVPVKAEAPSDSSKTSPENDPLIARLKTLKKAFDQGLLTEKEYEAKKQKLLEEL